MFRFYLNNKEFFSREFLSKFLQFIFSIIVDLFFYFAFYTHSVRLNSAISIIQLYNLIVFLFIYLFVCK